MENFEKQLEENLTIEKLDLQLNAELTVDPKKIFCENWKCAKRALEAIAALVKNPFVKTAINAVIKAGNLLEITICK